MQRIDFLWPGFLALLAVIPLIVAAYVLVVRRRRRFAVRFSSLALVRDVIPRQSWLRRYLPMALFLLALASLVIALGRPAAVVSLPNGQTTVVLTLDVSGSMRSTDIQPSRLGAAESAALSFIQRQKSSTEIGIVAFSEFAELIQAPTTDQEALQAAIESLTVGRRTAIGSGILESLDAIAMVDKNVAPSVTDPSTQVEPPPVPPGVYAPDIIVLLTDGMSNTGPSPLDAARQAADRGVRIYTIGYGTANGIMPFGGQIPQGGGLFGNGGIFGGGNQNFGGQGFGGGGFGGGFRMGIDETTLKQIASMTGGTYHPAASASQLQSVFQSLPTYMVTKHELQELSVIFAALGAVLAAAAIGLSLTWHPLP
ncbi:MAG: VWA domain-containing protein [Anaerolineales bacterium]|jgi:Ca-activated chloride channel family protein